MGDIISLIILLIGMFLFSFIGVIVLLRRTRGQSEQIAELTSRVDHLALSLKPQEPEIKTSQAPPELVPLGVVEPEEELVPAGTDMPPPVEIIAPEDPIPATVVSLDLNEEAKTGEQPVPAAMESLRAFIHGGNLWAAGGLVLLIAAFAMLIAYLGRRGFFTLEMGIISAVITGIVLVCLGWRFRLRRPLYFLLLQGGGIGILYLSIFAAHKLTPYFPSLISILLMSLLIPSTIILALFQNSQPLALLGFFGGFAAPILLTPGESGYLFLFSYYLVLDLGVLAIGYYRFWKGLNLLSFLCTFGSTLFLVLGRYEPRLFWTVEPFLISFMVIFTLLGIQGVKTRGVNSWNGALLLGTPFLIALLQWKVFSYLPQGYTIISLLFSALYLGLVLLIWKYRERFGKETIRPVMEGYLGLSMLLANLAIPLELSPEITSAIWAAEGVLVVFFGLRQQNLRIRIGGFLLHGAAAIAFWLENPGLDYPQRAFRTPQLIGSLVISLSALVMLLLLHRFTVRPVVAKTGEDSLPVPETESTFGKTKGFLLGFTLWAFIWWFGGWFSEFNRLANQGFESRFFGLNQPWAASFILSSLTALAVFVAARYFRCPWLYTGIIPSLIIALVLVAGTLLKQTGQYLLSHPTRIFTCNFFNGAYLWGWLVFFAVQSGMLIRSFKVACQETNSSRVHGVWLFMVILIALVVLTSTGRAYTEYFNLSPAWTSFMGILPCLGVVVEAAVWSQGVSGLPSFHRRLLFASLPRILCSILGLWFFVTLFFAGNPGPLPFYVPILNPLDLQQGFCIATILLWLLKTRSMTPPIVQDRSFILGDIMVFLWITAIIARSVHFYGHIPLLHIAESPAFHLGIFIFWACYGIIHIIAGHRLSRRPLWIAGAVLTVADIGKLLLLDLAGTGALTRIISFFIAGLILLFIGWVAPLPPAVPAETHHED